MSRVGRVSALFCFTIALLISLGSPRSIATAAPEARPDESARGGPSAETEAGVTAPAVLLDPFLTADQAFDRCKREVRSYTCTFLKQERIGNKLKPRETIEVRFRQDPLSIFMIWKKNADEVKRALFVDSREFVNGDGEKVARIEPAGSVIRLFVKDVKMPIHGERARAASRRTIDEFGFRSTLELLTKYNTTGRKAGVLDFRHAGDGTIDGRPTHVFVRYLPYQGPGGNYPDAKMVIHLDKEWLLPTAVYSYADREGKTLLGSYEFHDVKLNPPDLDDEDFRF